MKTKTSSLCVVLSLAASVLLIPSTADASLIKFWVAGRGDYFNVTSDLFNEFDSPFGGGAEVGLELMGITTIVEAVAYGGDQFLLNINAGLDFTFGDGVRFSVGGYTGPMLFFLPDSAPPEQVDLANHLDANQQAALNAAGGFSNIAEAEARFNEMSSAEEDLGGLAFGWNLIRGRVAVDFNLFAGVYLGVAGQLGYHVLISGEEVAAGAKNAVVDEFTAENDLPDELVSPIRTAVGAHPVDRDSLNGLNYDANLYLRIELF